MKGQTRVQGRTRVAGKSRMRGRTPKFVAVLVALAVLLLGAFAVYTLQKPQGHGELAFDTENVDVGKVPLGQTVTQHFVMRNIGDGPVTITKATDNVLQGC